MPLIEDRHLGDGVYASFDDYHIVLDLRGQDNTTRIVLDPLTAAALSGYIADVEKLKKAIFAEHKAETEAGQA